MSGSIEEASDADLIAEVTRRNLACAPISGIWYVASAALNEERARSADLANRLADLANLYREALAPGARIPAKDGCNCTGHRLGTDGVSYVPHAIFCASGQGLSDRVAWAEELPDADASEDWRVMAHDVARRIRVLAGALDEVADVTAELERMRDRALEKAGSPDDPAWDQWSELAGLAERLRGVCGEIAEIEEEVDEDGDAIEAFELTDQELVDEIDRRARDLNYNPESPALAPARAQIAKAVERAKRITELETELARCEFELSEQIQSAAMACENPPPNCGCSGCSFARQRAGLISAD